MIHHLYGLFFSRKTLKHRPQMTTIYKDTPFESTVSEEEAKLKGGNYNVYFTIKT